MDSRIAIVGMSAILPGGENVYESWEMIKENLDCLDELPANRVDVTAYYHPDKKVPDKIYCTRGGFIPDFDFDTREFGMNMMQMEDSDTNQTVTLVKVKEALCDAGIEPFTKEKKNIGCVLGVLGGQKSSHEFYSRLNYTVLDKVLRKMEVPEKDIEAAVEKYKSNFPLWRLDSFPGFLTNVTAGRCTNTFNLDGINCCVDAACASSLCALKIAIDELLHGNCRTMVCGATCTDCSIGMYMSFSKTPVFSTDKSVKAFDEGTKGMMIGEGSAMFVLKRYEDAVKDGDTIHAVIRGCASSSDGKTSGIYTPTVDGQEQCIRRAYKRSGVDPGTVTMVEAHGTGTRVGDKIELTALKNVFGEHYGNKKEQVAVGSVKSQIGHLKAVAGFAGLVKLVLALKHKTIPASINVKNPPILYDETKIQDSVIYINRENRPWFTDSGVPRRAGLSSFGFGGANYHAVVEEYEKEHDQPYRMNHLSQLVVLHAASTSSLLTLVNQEIELFKQDDYYYNDFVKKYASSSIPEADARLGFLAFDRIDSLASLECCASKLATDSRAEHWKESRQVGERVVDILFRTRAVRGKTVALFSGAGSEYPGMFSEVAMNWPQLRKSVTAMDEISSTVCGSRTSADLYPRKHYEAESPQTNIPAKSALPATVACSAGIYDIFADAGLKPDFIAGTGFGKLTASYANKNISKTQLCEIACKVAAGKSISDSSLGNLISECKNDVNHAELQKKIQEMYNQGARVFINFSPRQTLTEIVQQSLQGKNDYFALSVNSDVNKNSDTELRQCALELAVIGVSFGPLDTWEIENPFKARAPAKRKTTLRLSAATYSSKKTLKQRDQIMNDGRVFSYNVTVNKSSEEKSSKLEEELRTKIEAIEREVQATKASLDNARNEVRHLETKSSESKTNNDFQELSDVDAEVLSKHRKVILSMLQECDAVLQKEPHWLLANNNTGIFASFGGQGYDAMSELRELWFGSSPAIRGLISKCSEILKVESNSHSVKQSGAEFVHGFDLESWISEPSKCPPNWYLHSAKISYVLTLIVQIARYLDSLDKIGVDHKQMLLRLKGASGHSQGIIGAILLSISRDSNALRQKLGNFALYMMWQGLYCELAIKHNGSAREAAFAYEKAGDLIRYSPMLSVKGLSREEVQSYIDEVCRKSNSRRTPIFLSLINGPKLFVVSGYPNVLKELQETIKSRNAVASATFLKVGAAFHCKLNETVVDKIIAQTERLGINISSSDLSIPVYGTTDGSDLSKLGGNIMPVLVRMQAVELMDFKNIYASILSKQSKVTHVLDFGPGDGTAKLSAVALKETNTQVLTTAGKTPVRL